MPQNSGSKDATLYANRALCYLKLGQWQEAIEDCQQAIQIDSSLVKGHFFMGQALVELKKFDDALVCLKTGEVERCLLGERGLTYRDSNPTQRILPYFYENGPLNTEYGSGAFSYGEQSYTELATYQPFE